ncbi:YicC/YloC family endoribonuclease [Aurantimonas sp. VKM B-3413]|uniref:YicC/YloC family endoribonuclease n=1 Tax=Aurantimonas sp. VKM B-3413 TaxID=2779401 RepID=UPI001E35314F|nr:YicC/YloC family endoribonuclease [Aurantimonas sp. VKM B-3413]MCB8836014.1 YicC family protein [Aurantimonas sp. VKM B-3413]
MAVQSMTGFARHEGSSQEGGFLWELRSVNGKGLDLRLRLPQGLEALEPDLRRLAAGALGRGNIQASLQFRRADRVSSLVVNENMLQKVLALSNQLVADGHAGPPAADGILAIKGIIETGEDTDDPEMLAARSAAVLAGFREAIERLAEARRTEGQALAEILAARLREISGLVDRAERDPARSTETIRTRLRDQVAALIGADDRLDEGRLHQEAALLATRADIREELDRLRAHVEAATSLLREGGPIGRRLEFLSQEFHRESNTICSKSNAASLTAIGLELKVVVDQFREQVQNLE